MGNVPTYAQAAKILGVKAVSLAAEFGLAPTQTTCKPRGDDLARLYAMMRAKGIDPDRTTFAATGAAGAKARAAEVAKLAAPTDPYLSLFMDDLGEARSADEIGQTLRRFVGTTFVDPKNGRRNPVAGLISHLPYARRTALAKAARLAAEERHRTMAKPPAGDLRAARSILDHRGLPIRTLADRFADHTDVDEVIDATYRGGLRAGRPVVGDDIDAPVYAKLSPTATPDRVVSVDAVAVVMRVGVRRSARV